MNSMTGFGRATAQIQGWHLDIEAQSVNQKRGFDLLISTPRDYSFLERPLREAAVGAASRGRLTLTAQVKAPPAPQGLRVNRNHLRAAHREAQQLAKDLGLPAPTSLEFLLRLPGVLETSPQPPNPETLCQAAADATRRALTAWNRFRQREGAHLARELARLLTLIQRHLTPIRSAAGKAKTSLATSLHQRLRDAALDIRPDDDRIAREIALLVERADITEELARLTAHLEEARRLIRAGGEARPLEFLLQEVGREVNTIGSKSQSLTITRSVVAIKAELEKMREQLQNLE